MTKNGYTSKVRAEWDTPEVRAGAAAIGHLVVTAAGCCTALSERESEQNHDMIALIMAKVEQSKKRIADVTFSSVPESEKQRLYEHVIAEAQEYFVNVMAQDC